MFEWSVELATPATQDSITGQQKKNLLNQPKKGKTMPNNKELATEGLVNLIVVKENEVEELKIKAKGLQDEADVMRDQLKEMMTQAGIKSVTASDGRRATIAEKVAIKIKNVEPIIKLCEQYKLEFLLQEIPAHKEIKEKEFVSWIKTSSIDPKITDGLEVKESSYLVIKS